MSVFKNFLIGQDQALNCLIKLSDGWGKPDEMFSARAWRLRNQHPDIYVWIDRFFFWDDNHCYECYLIEKDKRQQAKEYSYD